MKNEQNKENNQNVRPNRKTGFYYSFFTLILFFCLAQIGYGAILNIGKIISYKAKMVTLENVQEKAIEYNKDLKTEKKVITSDNSLEEIARNNLKMAEDDEVLVIINKKQDATQEKSQNKLVANFLKLFEKKGNKNADIQQYNNAPTEFVDE